LQNASVKNKSLQRKKVFQKMNLEDKSSFMKNPHFSWAYSFLIKKLKYAQDFVSMLSAFSCKSIMVLGLR